MRLKGTYSNLEDIPERAREFYIKKDGMFCIEIEGMVPKTALQEFRNNNIQLRQQIEILTREQSGHYMNGG